MLVAAGTAVIAPIATGAQSPSPTDPPVSYVASVKPDGDVQARSFSEYSKGGRLTATAVTAASLVRIAYRLQSYQLVGAPGWIYNQHYDITANVDGSPAPSQQVLLRAILKDRFKLLAHQETRDMPVFALVVARADGKLGPQLSKSSFDCAAYSAGPHPPPEPGRTPNCATRIGPRTLSGKGISMATLAASLAPFVSRFTVDKTGLTGGYDLELTWTPDPVTANPAANPMPDVPADALGPSVFVAVQQQLGLKLVTRRGPVSVLVLDHIEEPSEN